MDNLNEQLIPNRPRPLGWRVEPNTMRKIQLAHAGGGRLAVFGPNGEFLLEVTPSLCMELCRDAETFNAEWAKMTAEERQKLGGPLRRSDFDYLPLSSNGVSALGRDALVRRCMIEGVSTRDAKGVSYSTGVLRNKLAQVYALHAEVRSDAKLRELTQRCSDLEHINKSEGDRANRAHERCLELEQSLVDQKTVNVDRLRDKIMQLEISKGVLEGQLRDAERQILQLGEEAGQAQRYAMQHQSAIQDNRALKAVNEKMAATVAEVAGELESLRASIGTREMDTNEKTEEPKTTNALAPVGDVMKQAVTLAAMQRASKVAATQLGGLLEKSGLPNALVQDARVQKLLGLAVPMILMQFGDKLPGLKNATTLQPLAQQKMIMDLADILDVTMGEMWAVLGDVTRALNEGTAPTIEQLPSD